MTHPLLIKRRIKKLSDMMSRDKYGNILGIHWNGILMQDIRELEKQLEQEFDWNELKASIKNSLV
jgi:hypothetical protein